MFGKGYIVIVAPSKKTKTSGGSPFRLNYPAFLVGVVYKQDRARILQ